MNPVEEEEKEEGELEEGELEEDEAVEETQRNPSPAPEVGQEEKACEAERKVIEEEEHQPPGRVPIEMDIKEEGKRREVRDWRTVDGK